MDFDALFLKYTGKNATAEEKEFCLNIMQDFNIRNNDSFIAMVLLIMGTHQKSFETVQKIFPATELLDKLNTLADNKKKELVSPTSSQSQFGIVSVSLLLFFFFFYTIFCIFIGYISPHFRSIDADSFFSFLRFPLSTFILPLALLVLFGSITVLLKTVFLDKKRPLLDIRNLNCVIPLLLSLIIFQIFLF